MNLSIISPNFDKANGLITAIIQHSETMQVLMCGYMNAEAYEKTIENKIVTFYSRTKQRLWTKGETSGNYLRVQSMDLDCDQDALLIQVLPEGNTCHLDQVSCFTEREEGSFLYPLENKIISSISAQSPNSYTYQTYQKGIDKMAQKVGEEAVEVVIEAMKKEDNLLKEEAADLLYHLLLLLNAKGIQLKDVESVLRARSK